MDYAALVEGTREMSNLIEGLTAIKLSKIIELPMGKSPISEKDKSVSKISRPKGKGLKF